MRVLGKAFREKEDDHKRKVDMAYLLLDAKWAKKVLPGGKAQADAVISAFAHILNMDLDQCDEKTYTLLLYMFVHIWARTERVRRTDNQIRDMLLSKYSEYIHCANVDRILMFAKLNMQNSKFSLKNPQDGELLAEMARIAYENRQIAEKNEKIADRYTKDPDYGLIPAKPIYTDGAVGSYQYLNSLCTDAGEDLCWKRIRAGFADGIEGMIDCYELHVPDGKLYGTLYLNLYALSNSQTAPAGYMFIDQDTVD